MLLRHRSVTKTGAWGTILSVGRDRRRFHAPRQLVAAGSAGLRRKALPSTAAIIWLPRVMSPARGILAAGQSGAGSRRRALAAPPPRRAGSHVPPVAHDPGADLDELLAQGRERPLLNLLRQGQRAQEVSEVVGQGVELGRTALWRGVAGSRVQRSAYLPSLIHCSAVPRPL